MQETLLIDPAASQVNAFQAKLRWPPLLQYEEKTELNYFSLFYPTQGLASMLSHTNKKLASKGYHPLTHGEFFRWLGGRLMMTCSPERGPLRTYWNVGDSPGSVYVGQDFGRRLLMTRHRFEHITAALSFSGRDDNLTVDDVSFLTV